MPLILLSFLSGILTVLAPCVLPVLPVILGTTSTSPDKKRSVIVIASFAISVYLFSIILKASTALIDIPPEFWKSVTAIILIVFGWITVFPTLWEKIALALKLQNTSDSLLHTSQSKQGIIGPILVGASLGPVFSSCSPTYSLILATIFPVSFVQGSLYLLVYIAGLVLMLGLIAAFGYALTQRLRFLTNPNGIFRKSMGILFILLGLAIFTGIDKKIETGILDIGFFDVTKLEQKFVPSLSQPQSAATSQLSASAPRMELDGRTVAAPEITGISDWLNTDGKVQTLSDLKGKVVIIDFWTYSCINCQRTLPYLRDWDKKYREMGLVILGIHAPEFAFEHKIKNVSQAVKDAGISYPVGLDNDFTTWKAYNNQYWPAKYFIDKKGNLRHYHFGEGQYEESERIIQYLLSEDGPAVQAPLTVEKPVASSQDLTPETYLGYSRANSFAQRSELLEDALKQYIFPSMIQQNAWALDGKWNIHDEQITSVESGAKLRLGFAAKEAYLVIESPNESVIQVFLNAVKQKDIVVSGAKLYTIVSLPAYTTDQLLELRVPAGVSLHAFTFGG